MFAKRLRTVANALLLLCVVALAGAMLAPALLGYERYILVSGSMTGTYDTGSVVYAKPVPVADLRVGDVITYAPPAGATSQALVTHRISGIGRDAAGDRLFRTKGDANQSVDPWRFSLDRPTQARVEFGVPYVGHVVNALIDRDTRMLVIGLPAVLIALLTLARLVRDVRRDSVQPAGTVATAS